MSFSKIAQTSATIFSLLGSVAALERDVNIKNIVEGKCPDLSQNKPVESFNTLSMAGLWYEYVWDAPFDNELDYVCSSHIWLQDENPNSFYIFNTMYHPKIEEEKNEATEENQDDQQDKEASKPANDQFDNPSSFYGFNLLWEPKSAEGHQRAKAYYTRNKDSVPNLDDSSEKDGEEKKPASIDQMEWSMQIVHTDYHQYALGMVCKDIEQEDGGKSMHEENWFMLSREK